MSSIYVFASHITRNDDKPYPRGLVDLTSLSSVKDFSPSTYARQTSDSIV